MSDLKGEILNFYIKLSVSLVVIKSGIRNKGEGSAVKVRWFILLTVLWRWSRCLSYSLLLCGSFYEAICFKSCLVLFCSCVFQSF